MDIYIDAAEFTTDLPPERQELLARYSAVYTVAPLSEATDLPRFIADTYLKDDSHMALDAADAQVFFDGSAEETAAKIRAGTAPHDADGCSDIVMAESKLHIHSNWQNKLRFLLPWAILGNERAVATIETLAQEASGQPGDKAKVYPEIGRSLAGLTGDELFTSLLTIAETRLANESAEKISFNWDQRFDVISSGILALATSDEPEAAALEPIRNITSGEYLGWLPHHPKQNPTEEEKTWNKNQDMMLTTGLKKLRGEGKAVDSFRLIQSLARIHDLPLTTDQYSVFMGQVTTGTLDLTAVLKELRGKEKPDQRDTTRFSQLVTLVKAVMFEFNTRTETGELPKELQAFAKRR
jgi:hypothetical protein